MEDKTGKQTSGNPTEPESRSAFTRRPVQQPGAGEPQEKPIPSQPRSFSPVRPQRGAPPRKNLSTAPATGAAEKSEDSAKTKTDPTVAIKKPETSTAYVPAAGNTPAAKSSEKKPAESSAASAEAAPKSAAPADDEKATPKPGSTSPAIGTAATGTANPTPRKNATAPPQSSGAGGDTIRLRVSPRPQARTLNTAPGRGVRRRLPDIRQGKTVASSSGHYGPFSLFFGFLWLVFKMIFFTVLTLGLGALIGFMAMTEYIKTPEVTVPNVSGMKIEEAFDVLSEKNLGVIKRGTESSGLVAPGEIISQQPPAGATAKVDTDVGVVISSGRAQYVVPNVVNETRENAVNKIRGARLEVGNILTVEDSSVARGNVISQSPIGGTGQDEPVKVDLMISAGPPGKSLTMPDLTGHTVLEAKAALKAVGIEDVVTEPADAPPDAKVIGHDPLVGKTVFQTDRVTLQTSKE